MKKQMLLATGILMLFCQTKLFAQKEGLMIVNAPIQTDIVSDTLFITLSSGDKIILTGGHFNKLNHYQRADSLKTWMIADLDQAFKQSQLQPDATNIHYFVKGNTRRLKVENPEFSNNTIDVNQEIFRMQHNLPKHKIVVYDMQYGIQIHFYLKDLEAYKNSLGTISLDEAIRSALSDKSDRCSYFRIDVTEQNNTYKVTDKTKARFDMLEVVPSFGMGLIGNTFAPVAGADLYLGFTNKYNVRKFKTGIGFSAFPFVSGSGDVVTGVSLLQVYELRAMYNLTNTTRNEAHWFGLQGGLFSADKTSTYDKAYKFGFIYEGSGPFNYSFDFIRDQNNRSIYGLTVKLPF